MRSTFPLLLPLTHCSAPHSVLNIAEVLASAQQPCAGERSGSASGTPGSLDPPHLLLCPGLPDPAS